MIRRTAQRLRQTPQYTAARRRTVRALRRSDLVQRAVAAISPSPPAPATSPRRAVQPLRLPAGAGFPAGHGRRLPIVVVLALGLDAELVPGLLAGLRREQVLSGAFRPVVVADCPVLQHVRGHGWVCEVLLDRQEWERLHPGQSWHAYVREHVRRVVRTCGASAVVPLVDARHPDAAALLGLATSISVA